MSLSLSINANGLPVPLWQGRQICSKHDPLADAQKWVERHRAYLSGCPTIVVLGIGAGFGLTALVENFPTKKIIVIEDQVELINFCKKSHSLTLSSVNLVQGSSVDKISANSIVKQALCGVYGIVESQGNTLINPEMSKNIRSFLLGRDQEAFSFQLSLREDLSLLFSKKEPKLHVKKSLYSIKTLNQMLPQAPAGQELSLIHISEPTRPY